MKNQWAIIDNLFREYHWKRTDYGNISGEVLHSETKIETVPYRNGSLVLFTPLIETHYSAGDRVFAKDLSVDSPIIPLDYELRADERLGLVCGVDQEQGLLGTKNAAFSFSYTIVPLREGEYSITEQPIKGTEFGFLKSFENLVEAGILKIDNLDFERIARPGEIDRSRLKNLVTGQQ